MKKKQRMPRRKTTLKATATSPKNIMQSLPLLPPTLPSASVTLSFQEKKMLLKLEQDEITAEHIYQNLAKIAKDKNKDILASIAQDEEKHYAIWKKYTEEDIAPRYGDVFQFMLISKVFGITFAIKVLEKGEVDAQEAYKKITGKFPELQEILRDEHKHEKLLFDLIHEEKLDYIGSMVLGLNDALVELTGTLAGLTLAFRNTRLVGISGLITGIAASLSMMSSEYLSKKTDSQGKNPRKAAMYTGIAYIITVLLLVLPFFLFTNIFLSLGVTVVLAILIIAFFTYFSSIVHDELFKKKFGEMAAISLGVALISFMIGFIISHFLHIPVG